MSGMITVHIRKHEAVPDCGSFEVYYSDGFPGVYFYFEDNPGRRLRPEQLTSSQALEAAQEFARSERERLEQQ